MTELQPGGRRARAGARQTGPGRPGGPGRAGWARAAGARQAGASLARVTLQDVADRAGVSLSTASRVVNEGSRRVGPRLADRVTKAVADLGYMANLQARAVATGQSTMMGVIVHDIADPYFSSIAAGLIEVSHAGGAARHRVEHGRGRGGGTGIRLADAGPAGPLGGAGRQPLGRHRGHCGAARRGRRVHPRWRPGGLRRPGSAGHRHDPARQRRGGPGPGRGAGRARPPGVRRAGRAGWAGHRPGPGSRVRGRAGRLVGQPQPAAGDPRGVYPGRRVPGDERDPGGGRHPAGLRVRGERRDGRRRAGPAPGRRAGRAGGHRAWPASTTSPRCATSTRR